MAAHFTDKTLKFLRGLEKHNDREWFGERKDTYEVEVKAPLLELIAAVNDKMLLFAPAFVREPAKCAMRIYRDIRFSKNKLPYKTNVAAWWARTGLEKTSGGGYYFELNSREIVVAAGCYMPEKEQLLALRRMMVDRHEEVRAAMQVKGMPAFDGLKMARGPKGFDPEGPAADLILQRQWGIAARLPIEAGLQGTLAAEVVKRFKAATPLVELLNEPLLGKPRKPLF